MKLVTFTRRQVLSWKVNIVHMINKILFNKIWQMIAVIDIFKL